MQPEFLKLTMFLKMTHKRKLLTSHSKKKKKTAGIMKCGITLKPIVSLTKTISQKVVFCVIGYQLFVTNISQHVGPISI
jgi:hypothetical protein